MALTNIIDHSISNREKFLEVERAADDTCQPVVCLCQIFIARARSAGEHSQVLERQRAAVTQESIGASELTDESVDDAINQALEHAGSDMEQTASAACIAFFFAVLVRDEPAFLEYLKNAWEKAGGDPTQISSMVDVSERYTSFADLASIATPENIATMKELIELLKKSL